MTRNRTMQSRKIQRAGFTLVELLVVIVIIGILASLITVAVFGALKTAKLADMRQECAKIYGGFESFKEKFSTFPPDGNGGNQKMKRFVTKAFPSARAGTLPPGEMMEAESGPARSIVYWLSEVSTDPRQPFRKEGGGMGGSQQQSELYHKFYEFQAGRTYQGKYYPKDYDPQQDPPFLYFNAETYHLATYRTPDGLSFKPYDRGQSSASQSGGGSRGGGNSREYSAPETCQIIAAGLDKKLGTGGTLMLDSAQSSGNAAFISKDDEDNVVSFDTQRSIGDIKE